MRAHPQTDVKRLGQVEPERTARWPQFSILCRDGHRNVTAPLLDAQSLRPGDGGLDFVGALVAGWAVLQRGQAVAVQRCVGVGRIRLEILANEQAGLAMRIAARADQRDVRPERHVPGHFLPDEVEGVVGEPHVGAPARHGISAARAIELDGTRPVDRARPHVAELQQVIAHKLRLQVQVVLLRIGVLQVR